jgi:hypothetical protein
MLLSSICRIPLGATVGACSGNKGFYAPTCGSFVSFGHPSSRRKPGSMNMDSISFTDDGVHGFRIKSGMTAHSAMDDGGRLNPRRNPPRVKTRYWQWPGSPGEGRRLGAACRAGLLPAQTSRHSRRPSPDDREAARARGGQGVVARRPRCVQHRGLLAPCPDRLSASSWPLPVSSFDPKGPGTSGRVRAGAIALPGFRIPGEGRIS